VRFRGTPKKPLSELGFHPRLAPCLAACGVMPVVAALTQRRQIEQACRLGSLVVDVRHGQHHPAAGERMRLAVLGPAPFAAVSCAMKPHELGAQLPVTRVSISGMSSALAMRSTVRPASATARSANYYAVPARSRAKRAWKVTNRLRPRMRRRPLMKPLTAQSRS
jgi:hypothetical protein